LKKINRKVEKSASLSADRDAMDSLSRIAGFERAGKRNPNNKKYQFWQQNNHPIELFDNTIMDQKLDYIHMNPVVSGIVKEPEHYLYSSAIDYAGGKGILPILLIN